jgi:hypothetical protein
MKTIARGGSGWLLALMVGFLVFPTAAHAQGQAPPQLPEPSGFKDGLLWSTKPATYGIGNGVSASHDPGPYQGQIYCPVTGAKLAPDGSAVAVQTTIGEEKPTGIRKFFGAKSIPGMVIYVCCPECAKKVKSDPQPYAAQVINDHVAFSFCFADAPAQRPDRPVVKPRDQTVSASGETPPLSSTTASSAGNPLHR